MYVNTKNSVDIGLKGFELLAYNIVRQACDDYINASIKLNKYIKNGKPLSSKSVITQRRLLDDATRFFKSEWFYMLSGVESDFVFSMMEKRLKGVIN